MGEEKIIPTSWHEKKFRKEIPWDLKSFTNKPSSTKSKENPSRTPRLGLILLPTGGSPKSHGLTTHRRRVPDLTDIEKDSDYSHLNDPDEYDNNVVSDTDGSFRYFLVLQKKGTKMDDYYSSVLRACTVAQFLVNGRKLGRPIFAALMMTLVFCVLFKVFLIPCSSDRERRESNNGMLILQTFKDELDMAPRVVNEIEALSGSVMPKRVLENNPAKFTHYNDAGSSLESPF